MVHWTRFDPSEFELEFNESKLAAHDISVDEAAEVLWSGFHPLRDKGYADRYRLLGRTDTGRPVELVASCLESEGCVSLRGAAMKSHKQTLTDDQIEAEVLATRGDPSAWESLAFVPPSTSPRPAWMMRHKHLEVAARFHVLSVLHRLGAEANLALAQTDNVDITMLGKSGHAITIDVKTLQGTREWFVDQFSARKYHYLVFVEFARRTDDPAVAPRVYVVASEKLRKLLSRRKLTSVSLDLLNSELAAHEAWQIIMTEQAA